MVKGEVDLNYEIRGPAIIVQIKGVREGKKKTGR